MTDVTVTYEQAKLLHDLAYWGLGAARQPLKADVRLAHFVEHAAALDALSEVLERVRVEAATHDQED